jgi:hypothetical protein
MKFRWLTYAILGFTIINCTGNTESRSPKTYVVKDVSPDGYFNLGIWFERLNNFPDHTMARQFTQSVTVTNATPRESLAIRMVKGGYDFEDLRAAESDLLKEYRGAQQSGCDVGSPVTMITDDGNTDTFNIKSCSTDKITIQDSTNANLTYTYELLSPQSARIIKTYEAIDTCLNPSKDKPRVNPVLESRKIIRWGEADAILTATEKVSKEMVWLISKGAVQIPESLMTLNGGDEIEVSAQDLKALFDAPLRPDIQICPGLYLPRPNEPETPRDPQASPSPEPAYPIAPGGSPEPMPLPLPVPTLSPAPVR